LEVVKSLVEEGKADVDKADNHGQMTPLVVLTLNGNVDTGRFLVEVGKADVDKAENDGETPLFMASKEGKLEVVK